MIIYYALKFQRMMFEAVAEYWMLYAGFIVGFIIAHLIFE